MAPKEGSYQYRKNLSYVKQTPKFLQSLLNQNQKREDEKEIVEEARREAFEAELTDEEPLVVETKVTLKADKNTALLKEFKADKKDEMELAKAKEKLDEKLVKFETDSVLFGKADKSVKRSVATETEVEVGKKPKIAAPPRNKNLLSFGDDEEI